MGGKCNVLMLHGFRMNAEMMRLLMADVVEATENVAEWHFAQAAVAATGPALPLMRKRFGDEPGFEWWNAQETSDGAVVYRGLKRSVEGVAKRLTRARFDVVAGYSQGAAMTTALTALLQAGELAPKAPWNGAILFNSGPPPCDPSLAPLLSAPLELASLHVMGGPRDMTHAAQIRMSQSWSERHRHLLEHGQGHTPPTRRDSAQVLDALVAWLERLAAVAA